MGLTKDTLRPRSDAGRGRRSGVKEDAARPGVIRRGIDFGAATEGSVRPARRSRDGAWEKDAARPRVIRQGIDSGGELLRVERLAYDFIADQRMGERRSLPRAQNVRGRAARREAASLLRMADQRMSKLRPSCQSAMPQGMRSRSKRQTHSDRLVEDEAQRAFRP